MFKVLKAGTVAVLISVLLSGCGSNETTSPSPTPTPTPTPTPPPPAGPSRLDLTASPTRLLLSGSTVTVTGRLTDTAGAPLAGRTVTLATTAGTLSASSAVTDSNGSISVTLTGSASATVRGSSTVDGSVDVPAVAPFTLGLDSKYSVVIPNDPVDMFITVTPVQGIPNPPSPSTVTLACGNGQTESLGDRRTATCTYRQKDSYVATVTATAANGFSTSASTRITAEPKPVIVSLSAREVAHGGGGTEVEMEFVVVGAPNGAVCSWEFGEGSTTTGSCNQNFVYSTADVDDGDDVTVTVLMDPRNGGDKVTAEVTFTIRF